MGRAGDCETGKNLQDRLKPGRDSPESHKRTVIIWVTCAVGDQPLDFAMEFRGFVVDFLWGAGLKKHHYLEQKKRSAACLLRP